MMDHAELDFGIYRIMNQKRNEIKQFLENDLLPQVKTILAENSGEGSDGIKARMAEIRLQLGDNVESLPETIPMVNEYKNLKEKLSQAADTAALENEVYSHLTTFFSRYYDAGDFVSKRRYKNNTYAIPYSGEEVKLHWANSDQYYIKTSEYFQNYTFKAAEGKMVHFVLKDASTELNNNKAQNNFEHRFALYAEDDQTSVEVIGGELNIYFTYELMPKATKQKDLCIAALNTLRGIIPAGWEVLLAPVSSTDTRSLLEKHITDYTAKNSFDYFIHKDLGGFLRRELDFYIKNEVLHIDDLDVNHVNAQLAKVKAIKGVGDKIIRFLASLEDFQKKLWLKKKFVVQTDYCITLDRVPEPLYPDICANVAQREEWVRLFAIDEIEGTGMFDVGYSEPLTVEFLKANPYLVLDTALFSESFKHKLLASMENVEEEINGLLVNSENFQALQLLKQKYSGLVKCVYIDPPYNTGDDDFAYKDSLMESSWITLIHNRLELTEPYYKCGGTFSASIDINEIAHLTDLLDFVLGKENRKANITVRRASISGAKVINPGPVNISENVLLYNNGLTKWEPKNAYREKEYDDRYGNIIINPDEPYERWQFSTVLEEFAKSLGIQKSKLRKQLGNDFDSKLLEFVIKNANGIVQFANLDENSVGAKAIEVKQQSIKEPTKIFHLEREDASDYYVLKGKVILFYKDRLRWMGDGLVPVEQISDIWDDVLPNDLHNEGGVQLKKGKKPEKLINRIFEATTNEGEYILDYFAGSATSGAVAIKSKRKFINIEANEYFDDIPLKRLKNTLNGDKSGVSNLYSWKGGGCFKYIRLEQYEDSLNNLIVEEGPSVFKGDGGEQLGSKSFKESYMLGYMLDTETKGSLFNMEWFVNPFAITMKTTKNNELLETKVDIVETFNFLIGLNVETVHWHQDDSICVVEGTTHRDGEKTLVIWRDCTKVNNDQLNRFFEKMDYSTLAHDFDVIYVNGDNKLPNMRRDDDRWKVVLIEEEFKARMFEEE